MRWPGKLGVGSEVYVQRLAARCSAGGVGVPRSWEVLWKEAVAVGQAEELSLTSRPQWCPPASVR